MNLLNQGVSQEAKRQYTIKNYRSKSHKIHGFNPLKRSHVYVLAEKKNPESRF